MKRKKAKEILAESFRELAEKKNVDKITIQDITDNCGYSPATFYRNYKDKYDLIAWDYTRGISDVMSREGEKKQWKDILLDGAEKYYRERDYLTNLLLHTSGFDAFFQYMVDINYDMLRQHIKAARSMEEPDEETDMYIRLYCLGTVGLSCEWILGRYEATPEEIAEIYEKSLPVPLQKYLAQK